MLKFELKKIWRQKKLLWLLLVVLLGVGSVVYQNLSEQDFMKERALKAIQPYVEETDGLYYFFQSFERDNQLDAVKQRQQEHVIELGTIFFRWKGAIQSAEWKEIPSIEHEFLQSIKLLEEAGGGFNPLFGMEREQVIQKNDWLLKHQLPYVDAYSLSPPLVLKESSNLLLSLGGLVFLVLFFGNAVTSEKEQQTWLTLKTQPIHKWKRMIAKYLGTLFVLFFFLLMVVCIGSLIPYLFGEQDWHFSYPQLIQSGEDFTFISTFAYLGRIFLLFFCAGAMVFSLIMALSTQLKSSFAVLILTGFIGSIGFSVTLLSEWLQSFWNPFHLLSISTIVSETAPSSFWIYPLSAICWSFVLVGLSVAIPEREKGLLGTTELKNPFNKGKTQSFWDVCNSARFEWRKLKRQGKLKQSLIVLGLFVVIGYFLIGQISKQKEGEVISGIDQSIELFRDTMIPEVENRIASIDENRKKAEESGDELLINYYDEDALHQGQTQLAYLQDILSNLEMGKRAYEQQDWQAFYEYQLFSNRLDNGEFDHEYMDRRIGSRSYVSLAASIAEKKWLMKYQVQPVIAGELITTIYDNWENKESKKWQVERSRKVDNSGLFSLYLYFDNYLYFIPLLLLLFVVGSGFAGERGKRPNLQLLQTQPLAKQTIFFGKGMTAGVVGLAGLLVILAFAMGISTVFNRFGDWYYPILHYNSKSVVESAGYTGMRALEGGFHFIPLGRYVIGSILLLLCIYLFIIALSNVLGLWISHPFIVFCCVAISSGIGYFASNKLGDYAQFSPFTYLDIGRIVNGEVATVLNNPGVTVGMGCFVLLTCSIGCMAIGYAVLRFGTKRNKVKHASVLLGQ